MFLGRRNWNNFFLGLLVVVSPWLGLPVNFKNFLLSAIGLLISLFALARIQTMSKEGHHGQVVSPTLTSPLPTTNKHEEQATT